MKCVIVMESLHGKSHCEKCGRQWEAATPQGSENHCARELGSRVVELERQLGEAQKRLKIAVIALEEISCCANGSAGMCGSPNYDPRGLLNYCIDQANEALQAIGELPEL